MHSVDHFLARWQKHKVFLIITISALVLDQVTKLWIKSEFALGQSSQEYGLLRITHIHNPGGVWGIDIPQALAFVLSGIALVTICVLYFRYGYQYGFVAKIACAMLIGGTAGNLVDRIAYGYVIDFIDVRLWGSFHWPTFNLADSAVVIGAILLAYSLFRVLNQPQQEKAQWDHPNNAD